ncbi:hypothetical protein ACJX0J_042116, partial [Zea mays]
IFFLSLLPVLLSVLVLLLSFWFRLSFHANSKPPQIGLICTKNIILVIHEQIGVTVAQNLNSEINIFSAMDLLTETNIQGAGITLEKGDWSDSEVGPYLHVLLHMVFGLFCGQVSSMLIQSKTSIHTACIDSEKGAQFIFQTFDKTGFAYSNNIMTAIVITCIAHLHDCNIIRPTNYQCSKFRVMIHVMIHTINNTSLGIVILYISWLWTTVH